MSSIFGTNVLNSVKDKYENQVSKKKDSTPKLNETTTKYYEELKAKYSNAEFVVVSKEEKDSISEIASRVKTDKSMVVVISEDELEKMATDETIRAQNEKLIDDAHAQFPEMKKKIEETGFDVKSFGMQLNGDGTVSYFAVVDKSISAQKERIEENLEARRAEKKEERKEDLATVTASSMEELLQKIKDTIYEAKADSVRTEQEKMVGQNFDLRF